MLKYGGEKLWHCVWWLCKEIFQFKRIPTEWTRGLIFPIYKKGDKLDTNNYRGITLLSVVAKVFSTVLNNRLVSFCESKNIILEEQGGFRTQRSTLDHVFTLLEVLKLRKMRKQITFIAFIDLRKAYDSVMRVGLWKRLYEVGIRGDMWNMIIALYEKHESAVLVDNKISIFFEISRGVKQGCPLSCLLFNLFIDGIAEKIKRSNLGIVVEEGYLSLSELLYADDVVLIAKSPKELQEMISIFYEESSKWQLTINAEKTKIMVFGMNNTTFNFIWQADGKIFEVVECYQYLGVEITSKLSIGEMRDRLMKKAKRAETLAFGICRHNDNLPLQSLIDIWKQLIRPAFEYGAEICKRGEWHEAEKLQNRVAKRILHVSNLTANAAARGELGWWTYKGRQWYLILGYWHKLVKMDETRITKRVYRITREKVINHELSHQLLWAYEVSKILKELELEQFWISEKLPNRNQWAMLLKKKIQVREQLKWNNEIRDKEKLRTYRKIKSELKFEKYLLLRNTSFHRELITKLRVGTNMLRVETGRWKHLQICDRICELCGLEVEDEKHFLLTCPAYDTERKKMFDKIAIITNGAIRIEEMESDNARLDIIIGRGRSDENYFNIFKEVSKHLQKMMKFRASILFSDRL